MDNLYESVGWWGGMRGSTGLAVFGENITIGRPLQMEQVVAAMRPLCPRQYRIKAGKRGAFMVGRSAAIGVLVEVRPARDHTIIKIRPFAPNWLLRGGGGIRGAGGIKRSGGGHPLLYLMMSGKYHALATDVEAMLRRAVGGQATRAPTAAPRNNPAPNVRRVARR